MTPSQTLVALRKFFDSQEAMHDAIAAERAALARKGENPGSVAIAARLLERLRGERKP